MRKLIAGRIKEPIGDEKAWAEVIAHDYEGLVAKEEASLYEPGPTQRWLR